MLVLIALLYQLGVHSFFAVPLFLMNVFCYLIMHAGIIRHMVIFMAMGVPASYWSTHVRSCEFTTMCYQPYNLSNVLINLCIFSLMQLTSGAVGWAKENLGK